MNGLLAAIGGALLLTAALCFALGRKVPAAGVALILGAVGLVFPLP